MPLPLLLLFCGTLLHQFIEQGMSTSVTPLTKKEQEELVDKINSIRRGVKPTASRMFKMTWSEKAAQSAINWAKECSPESSPDPKKTVDGIYCGEARLQSTYLLNWTKIVDIWVSKKDNFVYGVGSRDKSKDILGYTQLIWQSTHEIGCAVADCKHQDFGFFYVCRTCPAGNMVDKIATPYEEGPSCEDCPKHCEDKLCTNPCNLKDTTKECKRMKGVFNCKNKIMREQCRATCDCIDKIVG